MDPPHSHSTHLVNPNLAFNSHDLTFNPEPIYPTSDPTLLPPQLPPHPQSVPLPSHSYSNATTSSLHSSPNSLSLQLPVSLSNDAAVALLASLPLDQLRQLQQIQQMQQQIYTRDTNANGGGAGGSGSANHHTNYNNDTPNHTYAGQPMQSYQQTHQPVPYQQQQPQSYQHPQQHQSHQQLHQQQQLQPNQQQQYQHPQQHQLQHHQVTPHPASSVYSNDYNRNLINDLNPSPHYLSNAGNGSHYPGAPSNPSHYSNLQQLHIMPNTSSNPTSSSQSQSTAHNSNSDGDGYGDEDDDDSESDEDDQSQIKRETSASLATVAADKSRSRRKSTASTSGSSFNSGAPPAVPKRKRRTPILDPTVKAVRTLKHNEAEVRRRKRLNGLLQELQMLVGCAKPQKSAVLRTAIEKVKGMKEKMEQMKNQLVNANHEIERLRQNPQPHSHHPSGSRSQTGPVEPLYSLPSSLSSSLPPSSSDILHVDPSIPLPFLPAASMQFPHVTQATDLPVESSQQSQLPPSDQYRRQADNTIQRQQEDQQQAVMADQLINIASCTSSSTSTSPSHPAASTSIPASTSISPPSASSSSSDSSSSSSSSTSKTPSKSASPLHSALSNPSLPSSSSIPPLTSYSSSSSSSSAASLKFASLSTSIPLSSSSSASSNSLSSSSSGAIVPSAAACRCAVHPLNHSRVFSGSNVAMDVVDLNGRILDCNELFASFVGYSREVLIDPSASFFNLTHPESLSTTFALLSNLLTGGNHIQRAIKKYITRSGQVKSAYITCWITRNPEGKPEYVNAILEPVGSKFIEE